MSNATKNNKTMDVQLLVSLMSDAYGKGLKAGHQSAEMKDNPEFIEDAVKLFASGLTDSLALSFGSTPH
jgi:hypothetical protein